MDNTCGDMDNEIGMECEQAMMVEPHPCRNLGLDATGSRSALHRNPIHRSSLRVPDSDPWSKRLRPRLSSINRNTGKSPRKQFRKATKRIMAENKLVSNLGEDIKDLCIKDTPATQKPNVGPVPQFSIDNVDGNGPIPPSQRQLRPAGSQEVIPCNTVECDSRPGPSRPTNNVGPTPCVVKHTSDGRRWSCGHLGSVRTVTSRSEDLRLWRIFSNESNSMGFVFGYLDETSSEWFYATCIREGRPVKYRTNDVSPMDVTPGSMDQRLFFPKDDRRTGGGVLLVSAKFNDQAVGIRRNGKLGLVKSNGPHVAKWEIA